MPSNFKKKKTATLLLEDEFDFKYHLEKHRKHKNQNRQQASSDGEDETDDNATKERNPNPVTEENNNKPYIVRFSDVCGRHLVAARNLKAGEKLIEVEPLAIGPWAASDPVCIGCYKCFEKGSKTVKCADCGWRVCSPGCSGLTANGAHKRLECIPLKEHNVAKLFETSSTEQIKLMYEAIFALRCLLLKKSDPERHALLLEMEALNELRQQISLLWKRNQELIVNRIRDEWKFEEFTESEIHTVCGIIEVNSFQIGQNDVHARALYPEAFYIMHDCTPNTTHTDDPKTQVLSIRLTNDLKAGNPITLSYSYTLQGTLKRRQHLYDSKFFWCQCKRCLDPTEFGTNCSTIKCTKCHNGHILTTNPLDQNADWKCKSCTNTMSAQNVLQLLDRLFKELDAIDGNGIELYEHFITKYRFILHDNHYLFLSAKHSLCQLYGKISGYLISEMSLEQIQLKEKICRDLLTVVNEYEPGLSRLRGVIMYELHAPIMIQVTYQSETRQINANQLKRMLNEVMQLLKQSATILSFEPPGSQEHEMALAAIDALQTMQGT